MQLVDQDNIEKRILYYISKMYSRNLKKAQDYSKLNKCIGILFIDFELKKLKEIPKYITKWNLREEDYRKIVLTDVIEIYIIEMIKVEEYAKNSKIDTWVKYIMGSEEINMEIVDEDIKQAQKVLEDISKDEHEQYLADLREKYIMDMNNIESTGIRKGIEQGMVQGEIKSKKEIAKNLKLQGVDIEIIINATGLTKEEIEKL